MLKEVCYLRQDVLNFNVLDSNIANSVINENEIKEKEACSNTYYIR